MPKPPSRALLLLATLGLFLLWSNSFVAMSYLLGSERHPAQMDWISLTVARFAPVTVLAALYLALARPTHAISVFRNHFWRCLASGFLGVTVYSFCLYWGIAHGIPAPIASLLTALSPLYLMILGVAVLGERLNLRKCFGFVIASAGLSVVALARGGFTVVALAPVAIAAVAPLVWAIQTTLSKPISRDIPADVWTASYLVLGGLPMLVAVPWVGGAEMLALNAGGWAALAFLSGACTLLGFGLWSWLLVYLPASTLGFTVFLNPPLAMLSQWALARLFPDTFVFNLSQDEVVGCGLVLVGLAVAVQPWGRRAAAVEAS